MVTLNTGTSIVDALKSKGQDSSYEARSKMASDLGIQNYTGTAEQNVQLLKSLNTPIQSTPEIPAETPITPTPITPTQPSAQKTTIVPTTTPAETPVEPPKATETPKTLEQTSLDSYTQSLSEQAKFAQSQYDKIQTEFDKYTADITRIDAENDPMIQSIKDTFARRINEMGQTNEAMLQQTNISGIKTNMSRYASQIQQGFVSKEVTNGMNRISELESQKLNAIELAKQALKSTAKDRWSTFSSYMDTASKAYNDKVSAVKELYTTIRDAETLAEEKKYNDLKMQQLQQEILQKNVDSYASGFVDFDENGDILMADKAELEKFAQESGISYEQLVGAVRNKAHELSKLSSEDRLQELQIAKAQRDLLGETTAEWQDAINNGWTTAKTPLEYLAEKKQAEKGGTTPLNETGLSRDSLILRLGKQVYGTLISDKEREFLSTMIDKGLKQGITENELVDTVLGFNIVTGNKQLANNLKQVLLQAPSEKGLAGFDMVGLSRLLNEGKDAEAIRKVELAVLEQARKSDPDGFVGESTVKSQVTKANDLQSFIEGLNKNPIGVVEGSFTKWIKKNFRGENEQSILSKTTSLVAEMRNALSGTAVTESEKAFLAPLIPELNDTPDNFMKKLDALKEKGLFELNSFRTTFGMPELDEKSLLNMDERINKYSTKTYTKIEDLPDDKFYEATELQKLHPDWDESTILEALSFNNEENTSVKTDVSKIKDGSKVTTSIGNGTATGIQGGSSAWKYGFDFVLSGGKGAKVPAPVGGEVVFTGNAKTPGNQVRIKMPNGEEMWISHLDSINVKVGQKITPKTIIGTQGNTGLVLNNKGQKLSPAEVASGRGTHLDITMKKPDGTYYTSQEVASLLGTKLI